MGALARPSTIIILLIVIILLFGANKLPDLARNLGQSLKIIKREVKELSEDDDSKAEPETDTKSDTEPKA